MAKKKTWTAAEMGRVGGKARAKALSAKRRREIAAMGAAAREARKRLDDNIKTA